MPVVATVQVGTVTNVWGTAVLRMPNGKTRPLKVGDVINKGDAILTAQNSIVEIRKPDEARLLAADPRTPADSIEQIITGLERGDPDVVPAAGLSSSLEEAIRVGRITEGIGAGSLEVASPDSERRTLGEFPTDANLLRSSVAAPPAVNLPPVAVALPASGVEDAAGIPLNLSGTDAEDGGASVVTVTSLPPAAQGRLLLPDGTPVVAGAPLTPAQAAALVFVPARDFNGTVDVSFTVADSQGATSAPATTTITVTPVNDPPVAIVVPASGTEDTPIPLRLGGSDPDGSVVGVTITSIPPGAGLFLADGTTPVLAGQTLTPAQAASLVFVPPANFTGSAAVGFTVTDNAGLASSPASVPITVVAVNDPPVARPDAQTISEDVAASGNVIGGLGGVGIDTDADGDSLSVSAISFGGVPGSVGSPVAGAYGSLVLNADGSYVYTPGPAAQALASGASATDSFSYTVSDGRGGSATTTLTISLTGVNDAPNARDDLASTPINLAITVPVLANDSDPDSSPLTVTSASLANPAQGSVAINPDGTLAFVPALNVTGPVVLSYTISDGAGGSDTASVTVFVGPNTPPDSADRTLAGTEDQPLVLGTANFTFTDVDAGQSLAGLRIDTLPAAGRLLLDGQPIAAGAVINVADLAAGRLSFVPAANANGAGYASFTFSVQDSFGAFDTAPNRITIDIGAVNDPPVAAADAATTPEDTPIAFTPATLLANDTDADGNPLTITSVQAAVNGTVAIVAGNVVFTPAANYNGPASFTYTISDGQGGSSTATVNLTVSGVNDPPVAVNDVGTTPEDTPVTLSPATLLGNDTDADGNPLTITSVQSAVNGTVAIVGGNVVFTPAANYNGPASFTYTISDGQGGSSTATVNLTVSAENDPPVAVNDAATTPEDTPVTLSPATLLGNDTDADGNPLTITSVQSAVNGTAAIVAGNVVFTPAADYTGPASFTYTISDGQGGTSTATVNLTVAPVNDPPVNSVPAAQTTAEDSPLVFSAANGNALSVADAEAGSLTVTVAVSNGSFTLGSLAGVAVTGNGTGSVQLVGTAAAINAALSGSSYASTADYHGPASLTLTTSDGSSSDSDTVALTVTSVVDIAPDSATTPEDTPVTISVLGNDSFEGAGRTITAVNGGAIAAGGPAVAVANGTVALNAGGQLVFTPTANYNGPASFSYTVASGGVTETATVSVTVTPAPDAPIAAPDSITTPEDTPVSGNVLGNDSDPDGTALTVTQFVVGGTTYAAGATATLAGVGSLSIASSGAYTFTPAANYNGPVPVATYTATDGALTASSTLSIAITPVNDAPLALPDTNTTPEGTPVSGNVLTNDSDVEGNALAVTQFVVGGSTYAAGATASLAGVGTLTIGSTGAYTFTPLAGYSGAAPVATYTVSDGTGSPTATSSSTLSITVAPINNAAEPTLSVRGIGRWTFDEGTGTSTTDAYNARTGTLGDTVPTPAVAPVWTSGHVGTSGSALDFDGTGSRVALDAATTQPLLGTATLSFWIRTTQTGSGIGWDSPAVIGSEQQYDRNDIQWGSLNDTGRIGLGLGDTAGVYSTTAVNDGVWHQVAITRDATTNLVSIYVDGQLEATGSPVDPVFTGTLNRLAGFGQTNNFDRSAAGVDLPDNTFLRAQLDDLRIYDRVLTADQVRAIQLVESGYHDTAIANDGSPMRIAITAADYTSLTVQGLEAGMTLTDGTRSFTSTGPDTVVNITGWTLGNLSLTGSGAATLAFDASNTVAGETRTTTQYLNIVTGTSLLGGSSAADTLTGGASADLLAGGLGVDTLVGGGGNDRLLGGAGADSLSGGTGRDVLIGGAGDDALTGGVGADVFAWSLADRGTAGGPAIDTIADFDLSAVSAGGDRLDLRDLLQGSNYVGTDPGNLQNFLDFNVVGGNTEIRISSSGGFAGGSYTAGAEDQRIVLSGIDIRAGLGLAASASDNQIIQELLTRGKLAGDGGA